MPPKPYLLYAYPWMPYPRRVIIYLREKGLPSSLVQVVHVSLSAAGNAAPPEFPPRPQGSLPVLVLDDMHIRQSVAIMNYLDELCDSGIDGFPKSTYSLRGDDILTRARNTEILGLADELLVAWNPVRTFGTGAGTMSIPAASKEMMRWVYRTICTLETYLKDANFSHLEEDGRGPSIAEIVLYQVLEFIDDCYGVDLTIGSGEMIKDVYGRMVEQKYEKLREFYQTFRKRDSAKRDATLGEVAPEAYSKAMSTWAEGAK
jgi:glutathione S-transferase